MGNDTRTANSSTRASAPRGTAAPRRPGTARKGNALISLTESADPPFDRQAMIATAAYYLAQRRGFMTGYEVDDWLAAERQVDVQLALAKLDPGHASS